MDPFTDSKITKAVKFGLPKVKSLHGPRAEEMIRLFYERSKHLRLAHLPRECRVKFLTKRIIDTNDWINQLVQEHPQTACRIFNFFLRGPRSEAYFKEPPWYLKAVSELRNLLEKRYDVPLRPPVFPVDEKSIDLHHWNYHLFTRLDQTTARYMAQTFTPHPYRRSIHKFLDKKYSPAFLPSAYHTIAVDEKKISVLEDIMFKVKFLGLLHDDIVDIPDNIWKPRTFRFFKENLMRDYYVDDPLKDVGWLNLASRRKTLQDLAIASTEDQGVSRLTERFPDDVRKVIPDSAKSVTLDNTHVLPNAFLKSQLYELGVRSTKMPLVNNELFVTEDGQPYDKHMESTVPVGYDRLPFLRHKLVKSSRSARKSDRKFVQRRWIDFPSKHPYRFPAEPPANRDVILPDHTSEDDSTAIVRDQLEQRFPSIESPLYWKQLVREWARGLGVLNLLDEYPKDPQPVAVIDQMANLRGTERLKAVLAATLPQCPAVERAQGHYMLVIKVKRQIEAWHQAAAEMMRVVEMIALSDTYRPVREAATIITCAFKKVVPALQPQLRTMLRSQLVVSRWVACQLLPISGLLDDDILCEVFAQLFDYAKFRAQQDQLVDILCLFPKHTALLVDEVSGRLNSGSGRDRKLACRILPRLHALHGTVPFVGQVKHSLLRMAFSDVSQAVRMEATSAVMKCFSKSTLCHHYRDLFLHKPADIHGKLDLLYKLRLYGFASSGIFDLFLEYLDDPHYSVRIEALRLLVDLEVTELPAFVKCLQLMVKDESVAVRLAALDSLQFFEQHDKYLPIIIKCYLYLVEFCDNVDLRMAAVTKLSQRTEKSYLSSLYGLLSRLNLWEQAQKFSEFTAKVLAKLGKAVPDTRIQEATFLDELKALQEQKINIIHKKRDFSGAVKQKYAQSVLATTREGAWRNVEQLEKFVSCFE